MPICRRNESKSGSFEKSITNSLSLAFIAFIPFSPLDRTFKKYQGDFPPLDYSKQGRSALTMRIFLPHFPEIAFVFFMTLAVAGPGSGGGLDDTLYMKNCLGNRERPDLALSITRCQRARRTIRPGGDLGLNNFHISCLAVPFLRPRVYPE